MIDVRGKSLSPGGHRPKGHAAQDRATCRLRERQSSHSADEPNSGRLADRSLCRDRPCIHSWISRRRKRQCFPIFDAGSSPTRASLYTVDFGTRRNRATSTTVRISPSRAVVSSAWIAVAVETSLFMTPEVSAWRFKNLSVPKEWICNSDLFLIHSTRMDDIHSW